MKGSIAIFAKTIGLSPVKTRLAEDIGQELAEEFYCLSVESTKEIIDKISSEIDNITPYWAIAEQNALNKDCWRNQKTIWTGEGNLGNRLHKIYNTLLKKHDYVILIGTDSPQLDPQIFIDAINKIKKNPDSCIIGPCTDGGFYLFLAAIPINESIWTNVKYSKSDTLVELAKQLENHNINIDYLPKKDDVDTLNDLESLTNSLSNNKNLLPQQEKLYSWLNKNKVRLYGC